jgi:hypothetical protein
MINPPTSRTREALGRCTLRCISEKSLEGRYLVENLGLDALSTTPSTSQPVRLHARDPTNVED